jgi:hypothetical protein
MKVEAGGTLSTPGELVHIWHHCHHCNAAPIVGKRYYCETCPVGPDNSLCETCYALLRKGEIKHPVEESFASALGTQTHEFSVHEGKPGHLFESWLQVSHPGSSPPVLPHPFVIRPIFNAGLDAVMAGYGFAVHLEGHPSPLLLTALHTLDEMTKKKGIDCSAQNKDYTGRELPAVITEVNIYDVFAPNWMMAPLGSAGPMLVLPDARTGEEEPYSDRDLAAFWIKEPHRLKPVPLASQPPQVGDPIWLVARPKDGTTKKTVDAVVVEITDRSLVFRYRDPGEKPKYSSGAPMINQEGQVVGVIVGGGEFRGEKLGHANHVGNIRRHITNAVK